jgi:hypothetical protein
MSETYVTDITHYLDKRGELANIPSPAKKLASFLVLLIDNTTSAGSANYDDTESRCRPEECCGAVLSRLNDDTKEILWHYPSCGHNGAILNWQNTK